MPGSQTMPAPSLTVKNVGLFLSSWTHRFSSPRVKFFLEVLLAIPIKKIDDVLDLLLA